MRAFRSPLVLLPIAVAIVLAGCLTGARSTSQPTSGKRFAWEGNQLGMSQVVPKPWTPLKLDGPAVEWWGGKIDFGQTLLPTQITSQGAELLSRPVDVVLAVGGKAVALPATTGPQVTARSDGAISATTKVDVGNVTITCANTVEFDGMLRVDMTVSAQKACNLGPLTLQMPMKRETAGYYRRFYTYDFETNTVSRDDLANSSGATDRGWQISFCPYVWLGQPERGLEWFCQSDEQWQPHGRQDALALKPSANEVVLEAHMIARPVRLNAGESWTVTFGISTTPSKPPLPNWRSWRYANRRAAAEEGPTADDTSRYKVFQIFWSGGPGGLKSDITTQPWPANPAAYQRERQALRQQGILYLPYGSLGGVPTVIPEWSVYGRQWSGGRGVSNWKYRGQPCEGSSTCIDQSTYRDFVIWTYVEAIKQLDLDGIYFDYGAPGLTCISPEHDHGRLASQGIYYCSLFGLREFYKRLYIATHEVKPSIVCLAHGHMPVLAASFVDMELAGESSQRFFNTTDLKWAQAEKQLAGQKWYVPDYVAAWNVPWAIPQMARSDGWFPVLLTEVTRRNHDYWQTHLDEARKYMRGALAMAALLDVHAITSGQIDYESITQYEAAKDRFGPLGDDVAFHPFWEKVVEGDVAPKNAIYPTLYTRPDRALLILSNLSSNTAKVTVDPHLEKLGVKLRDNRATEGMSNQTVPIDADGKVAVTLAGKDLAVITLE